MSYLLIISIIIINFIKYFFRIISYDQCIINSLKKLFDFSILFGKIFQWSFIDDKHNNKYTSVEIKNFISDYTNNTPYKQSDIDYKKILDIYIESKLLGDDFKLLYTNPINSGTISLIFKGKLNNKDIVIKLLRTDINNDLVKGLGLIKFIFNIISFIPYTNFLICEKFIEKNKQNFLDQTNFLNEVKNLELFYNRFKNNKFITVPNVYSLYTNKINGVIVMDYIYGKKINELSESDKKNFIIPFVKFIKNSIFFENLMHCDLHSGNIIFITEITNSNIIYKIGIIDIGMILNLSTVECNFCYYLVNSIFNNKFTDLIDYIFQPDVMCDIFDKMNKKKLLKFKDFLINEHLNNNLFTINQIDIVIKDIYIFLNSFEKFGFELSKNIHKIILSLLPIFGLIMGLGNNSMNSSIVKKELEKMENKNLFDDL